MKTKRGKTVSGVRRTTPQTVSSRHATLQREWRLCLDSSICVVSHGKPVKDNTSKNNKAVWSRSFITPLKPKIFLESAPVHSSITMSKKTKQNKQKRTNVVEDIIREKDCRLISSAENLCLDSDGLKHHLGSLQG